MKRKILITGGAGYIGSHVLYLLGEKGEDIIVYDNLSSGRKDAVHFGELVVGDLVDNEKLDAVIRDNKITDVLHFAGSIIVNESVKDPVKYFKNNSENSLNLIRLCEKNNVQNFIFSSTAAVYGLPKAGVADEETQLDPINPYGRSKLITEWMLNDISRSTNLRFVVLRYFNVAGASLSGKIGQSTPLATHLIKLCCQAALGIKDKLQVFGDDYPTKDGTCIRDYIHVDDLAMAHLQALDYLQNGGQPAIMNCGYGTGYTVKEVIDSVKKVTGKNFPIEIVGRRAGDPPVLIARADKIKQVLRWVPKYDNLDLIVKTAYEWERNLNRNNSDACQ